MKIRPIDDNIWAIDRIVVDSDEMCGLLDEFAYNQLRIDKVEKLSWVPKNAPRWLYINKVEDSMLGDNYHLINWGERCKYIAKKILKRELRLSRVNTNIQMQFQDTTFHRDGGDNCWTLIIFLGSEWNTGWGGEFICKTDETYVSIPYIPGNGAIFRGDLEHRGSAPNGMSEHHRYSIAFTYVEVE